MINNNYQQWLANTTRIQQSHCLPVICRHQHWRMAAVLIKSCLSPEARRRILFAAAPSAECDAGCGFPCWNGTGKSEFRNTELNTEIFITLLERGVSMSWVRGFPVLCVIADSGWVTEKEPHIKGLSGVTKQRTKKKGFTYSVPVLIYRSWSLQKGSLRKGTCNVQVQETTDRFSSYRTGN